MFESRDKRRAITRWQVPRDEVGRGLIIFSLELLLMGKMLLSEESGNGSDLNLGHMNFVRH